MCGLAGFINFKNNKELAIQAGVKQCHRGPDAQSVWVHNNVALSHQRLSIIDLDSRADQPLAKDGLVIIFNGEIYNYLELKKQIIAIDPSVNFKTTSDTEVLLELYRIKNAKCLDDLIGMFVFAIFDINNGKLFIARDHFGIKPLFFTQIDNCFAFSSELKSLIDIPGFDKSVNLSSLLGAVNYLWVPGNESMFNNCHKLPAAHYLEIDATTNALAVQMHKYWELDTNIKFMTERDAVSQLDSVLERSIKRHMVADVPVSSFLSGGLDSSLISVMASGINPNLSTFTIATSEKDKNIEQMPDDEKYAQLLADKYHFDHHEIAINAEIVNELPKMVYNLDEPIGDPAAINTYLICNAARKMGVKVLLSGMGADEIFFGYRRQKATLLALRYQKVPSFIRKIIQSTIGILPVKAFGRGIRWVRWAKRFISFADLPLEEAYMKSYSYYDQSELTKLFKSNINDQYQKLRDQHKTFFNKNYKSDPFNKICYTDINMFMLGLNLTYTDRASMAASVEVRVPFIDREVVSMAMQTEGSLKFKNKETKYILKKVAEKLLPNEIIYRPKASFGAPIRSWISNDLKEMVDSLLSKENVERRGFFNYEYIDKIIERDRKGDEDNAYRIYQLLTIELWCRNFLDN